MPEPTNFEQELLELINRARLNPLGEYDYLIADAATQTGTTSDITNALRFFGVDVASFQSQLQGVAAVPPLAWNDKLAAAAAGHTNEMIAQDEQSHELPGEAALGQRVTDQGYTWSAVGENVFAFTRSPLHGQAGFFVDWGYDATDFVNGVRIGNWDTNGDGIQDPAGHRNTILSATYVDVGISAVAEANNATQVGPYVVTQDFGSTFANATRLVGVVFSDANADGLYTAGEGVGGASFTADGVTLANWTSGGYQVEPSFGSGLLTVSATLPGQADAAVVTIDLQGENAKLDIVEQSAGWTYRSSVSLTIGVPNDKAGAHPFNRAVLLGQNDADLTSAQDLAADLTGNLGANRLRGMGTADDTLSGGGGNDTLEGRGGSDFLSGGDGSDIAVVAASSSAAALSDLGGSIAVTTNTGTDTVSADIETIQFLDRSLSYADLRTLAVAQSTPTSGNDTLFGSAADETISAMAGDDLIVNAGGGRDLFDGGAGDDTLTTDVTGLAADYVLEFNAISGVHGRMGSDLGRDTVANIENFEMTGQWDALLTGGAGANHLISDQGADTLIGGGGDDTLDGGAGNDRYEVSTGDSGRVLISDSGGTQDVLAFDDIPLIVGQSIVAGASQIVFGLGPDVTVAQDAIETVEDKARGVQVQLLTGTSLASEDGVLLAGTDGADSVVMPDTGLSSGAFAYAFLNGGDDMLSIGSDLVTTRVQAGLGNDVVFASGGPVFATGDGGNDTLTGGASGDMLTGDAGVDSLVGGAGDDTLSGGGQNDRIFGNQGNDEVEGGDGADYAVLGSGNDRFVDNGQVQFGDDTVFGNAGNDVILGGGGDDAFYGQNGNDSVTGGSGKDDLFGGTGADTLRGGTGNDTITGGDGRDLTFMGGGDDLFVDNGQGGTNGRDTVYANAGNDTVGGGNGDDVFNGQDGNDRLLGRLGNDRLFGGNQNDTMEGGDGNDTIAGGNGRDRAFMGNGNDLWYDNAQVQFGDDSVAGGNGNDTIRSDAGNDTLTGGAGADRFVFAATVNAVTLTDFELGTDVIHIASSLWTGSFDQASLDSMSNTAGGGLVLALGGGGSLTFDTLTSNAGLLDDIILV